MTDRAENRQPKGAPTLGEAVDRLADRDERRADAIYAAVFAAAYPHVSARVAMSHAEDAVEAWRAAQKGGADG